MKRIIYPLVAAGLLTSAVAIQAQTLDLVWTTPGGPTTRIDVSRNNTTIAFQITNGARVVNAATMVFVAEISSPGTVNDISVSADGSLVAVSNSGTGNNACRVFNSQTGDLVATLDAAGTGGIFAGKFSPNLTGTQRLAIGNATTNRRVRVYSDDGSGNWNWASFTDFGDALDLQPAGIGWNEAGTRFVAAFNTTLTPRSAVFDVSSPGAPVVTHVAPDPNLAMSNFSSAALSPDGSTAVITGSAGFALYSGTGPNQIGSTVSGLSAVRDARFLNDGSGFVIRTNNEVRSYDTSSSLTFTYDAPANVQYISRLTTGNKFYASATGGPLYEYTVGVANPDITVFGFNFFSRSIAFSPNGQLVVGGTGTGSPGVRLFSTATGAVATAFELPSSNDRSNDFAFAPDGSVLYIYTRPFTGATEISRVTRWNPITGASAGSDFTATSSGFEGGQNNGGIDINPDGSQLVFLNGNNDVVTIFNTADGTIFAESAPLPGTSSTNIRYFDNGNQLVFCTRGSGNEAIHRMPVTASTLNVAQSANIPTGSAGWVAAAPNGQFAVVRTQTQLIRFELPNLAAAPVVLGSNLDASSVTNFVDISPDSTMVVSAASNTGVTVRSAVTGDDIAGLTNVGIVRPIRFNPSGTHLGFINTIGTVYYASLSTPSTLGSTVFLQGPNSGPLPNLVVAWRTSGSTVTLPAVVIDTVSDDWSASAIADVGGNNNDGIAWQNNDPAYIIPGLVSFWSLDNDGVPTFAGNLGAPSSMDWALVAMADINGSGSADAVFYNISNGLVVAWLRDGSGTVTSTPVIGTAAADWIPAVAGRLIGDSDVSLFFQNATTSEVARWVLDSSAQVDSTEIIGTPGVGNIVTGFGTFGGSDAALVFQSLNDEVVRFWTIDSSGSVTGTGELSEDLPAGWSIIGVGRL
ncbi:MAG: hypothetical protein ACK4P3_08540 [Fimbriimonadaceae bacterium]